MTDYFEKTVTLAGAAPHFAEWKDEFVNKLAARYPFAIRDRGQRVSVRLTGQHVRVKMYPENQDVQLHTHYGSVCSAFGVMFLVFGILSLIGMVVSWGWNMGGFDGGFIACFIISGIFFRINEEFNIHDQVIAIAKDAWKDVRARYESGAEVVKVEQLPGEKYPTAYIAPVAVPVITVASTMNQVTTTSAVSATDGPKEALYCPFCGARRRANARFCELCGAEL
ncbi:MAG TPA: zinc ribbon domain-containing protein [Candidatus Lokiarchaeia archaeon]|nr:zinc ribbon domain-containing protein [Candidatus Lokiarchaeia archaeon]